MKNAAPDLNQEKPAEAPPPDLAAEIAAADAAAPGAPGETVSQAPAAVDPYDYERDARELVTFAYDAFTPLYPSLVDVWHDERRAALTRALGGLMEKRGWTAETLFIGWGAELSLAMVVVPAIVPTVRAIQADERARKAKEAEAAAVNPPAAPAAPAQDKAAAPAAPAPAFPDL